MRLTAQERAANQAAFRRMAPSQKAEYLFTYYRLPILTGVLALAVALSLLHSRLNHRDPCLYVGLVNVAVGSQLEDQLTEGFLAGQPDGRSRSVVLYQGLALAENPAGDAYEYMYASRLKLIAAIEAKELDVLLLNEEGYRLCSEGEYLADLSGWFPDAEVPLSEHGDAVDVTHTPIMEQAGLDGTTWLAVVANTPREDRVREYLQYVQSESPSP